MSSTNQHPSTQAAFVLLFDLLAALVLAKLPTSALAWPNRAGNERPLPNRVRAEVQSLGSQVPRGDLAPTCRFNLVWS
jgi:hypothetical protein